MKENSISLTVAIPTYRREQVLIDTLHYLLALSAPPAEILVLDQTEQHEAVTDQQLAALHAKGAIRWIRLAEPSIPKAMNQGLLISTQDLVLFLDDDIQPEPTLLTAHLKIHMQHPDVLVVGRVIQPWHEGKDFPADEPFHFACTKAQWVQEFMGGNFSVHRVSALELGGFDENFVRVAYRFEAEFSYRFRLSGRRIYYEPLACIHHLKVSAGGTRAYGKLLTTTKPDHAVGVYYHCLRTGSAGEFIWRFVRAATTRYHLRHPWHIPGTLIAELRGMLWAFSLWRQGPRYVSGVQATEKND